jgi:hypothetical protein
MKALPPDPAPPDLSEPLQEFVDEGGRILVTDDAATDKPPVKTVAPPFVPRDPKRWDSRRLPMRGKPTRGRSP